MFALNKIICANPDNLRPEILFEDQVILSQTLKNKKYDSKMTELDRSGKWNRQFLVQIPDMLFQKIQIVYIIHIVPKREKMQPAIYIKGVKIIKSLVEHFG